MQTFRSDFKASSGRKKKAECDTGKECGDVCIPKESSCRLEKTKKGVQALTSAAKNTGRAVTQKTEKMSVDQKVAVAGLLSVGGAIAAGVISEKLEDRENYAQFAGDRAKWSERGVPEKLKDAYDHDSKELQTSLLAAENRIKNNTYETMYVFDKKGRPIVIRRGGNASARLGITDIFKAGKFFKKGAVVTHNHPYAGGSLSSTDIQTAGIWGLSEIRATTGKEIYTLRPKKGGAFDKKDTQSLAATYAMNLSSSLLKAQKDFLRKQGVGGKIYYSTLGAQDKKVVKEISEKIEMDSHRILRQTIGMNEFRDKFDYRRVPRNIDPDREAAFNEKTWAEKRQENFQLMNWLVIGAKENRSATSEEIGAFTKRRTEDIVNRAMERKADSTYLETFRSSFQGDSEAPDPESDRKLVTSFLSQLRIILERSYTSGIDRFLEVDVADDGSVSGHFQDGDKVVQFRVNEKKISTKLATGRFFKQDSWLQDEAIERFDYAKTGKADKCVKGISCGEACIAPGKECDIEVQKIAKPVEMARLKKSAVQVRKIRPAKTTASPRLATKPSNSVASKSPDRFEGMTIRELKREAQKRGVYRYSEMNTSQLKESIRLSDQDPAQQDRLRRTFQRNANTPRKARALRLNERSKPERTLTDALRKWDRIQRITKLSGVDPQLMGAAVGAIALGITLDRYNRMKESYRRNFPDSAANALERADKMEVPSLRRLNVTFAVGGGGEGTSGQKIVDLLDKRARKEDAGDLDKWFKDNTHFVVSDNREFSYTPVNIPRKDKNGRYSKRFLALNSTRAFGSYLTNFKRGKNEAAIDLAAKLFAYGNARKQNKPNEYANKNRTFTIIAHDVNGNTVNEAMEILARMSSPRRRSGNQIIKQINVVKLGTTDFGVTDRLARERTITSALDPYSFLPMRNDKWISTVKGHELEDYLSDDKVYDELLQAAGAYGNTAYSAERRLERRKRRGADDRVDSETRDDAKIECKVGKQCGNACIPEDQTCRKNEAVAKTVKNVATGAVLGAGAAAIASKAKSPKSAKTTAVLNPGDKQILMSREEVKAKDELQKETNDLILTLAQDKEIRDRVLRDPSKRKKLLRVIRSRAKYSLAQGEGRIRRQVARLPKLS